MVLVKVELQSSLSKIRLFDCFIYDPVLTSLLGLTGAFGVPYFAKIVDRRVTAWDGVSSFMLGRGSTVRPCPAGPVLLGGSSRRATKLSSIGENGPDPDGSSLTSNYCRSLGNGVEKTFDHLT